MFDSGTEIGSTFVEPSIGVSRDRLNFMCYLCEEKFSEMQILKDHMKTHQQIPQLEDGNGEIRLRNPDVSFVIWKTVTYVTFSLAIQEV